MGARSILSGVVLVFTFAALILPANAFGGAIPATNTIIQVTATSNGHTATFSEVFPVSGGFSGEYRWTMSAPEALTDGDLEIATIDTLEVVYNADPQVDLEFALTNGSLSDDVSFNITTTTIIFDAVVDPEMAAFASVTLTQGAGSAPGASLTGLFPGGKLYQARYSTHPIDDTDTVFGSLVSSFSTSLSQDSSELQPISGMSAIPGNVYMMESGFNFILSAGDQASGTSAFLITPEPASLALMGLAGLLFVRRGRRD